jgi:hypothetical protein
LNSVLQTRVCIIGAGPYGLSIAAHLRHVGVDFRIFGSPMRRWLTQMPKAMLLKSEGCASGLPDPEGRLVLPQFCSEQGLPFAEYGTPLSREIFARYALSFQQNLVPQVEDVLVDAVSKTDAGFEVRLSSGETLRSAQVVVATGLDQMEQIPEQLGRLPSELCSHSAAHYDLSKFKGKVVIVIGDQLFRLLVLVGELQGDVPVPRFSRSQSMTDENREMTDNPIFQPPTTGGTKGCLHSRKSNLPGQAVKELGGTVVNPKLKPFAKLRPWASQTLIEGAVGHHRNLVPGNRRRTHHHCDRSALFPQ